MVRVDINGDSGPSLPPSLAAHLPQTSTGYGLSNASSSRISGGSLYRSSHHQQQQQQHHKRRSSGGAQQQQIVCRSPPNLDDQQVLTDLCYYGSKRSSRSASHTGTHTTGSSSGSHRSSGASLLCRCGSGGALLPPASSPPLNTLQYSRGAQSLPSTPNACRRPISPSMRPLGLESASGMTGIIGVQPYRDEPCYAVYGTAPSTTGSDLGCVAMSESAVLSSNIPDESTGRTNLGSRALHHWTQQRRNLRYRTTSQPLMKLSTLVIILLAFLIIGFIVLSPLFHYLMS